MLVLVLSLFSLALADQCLNDLQQCTLQHPLQLKDVESALPVRLGKMSQCFQKYGCSMQAADEFTNFTSIMPQPLRFLIDELNDQFYSYTDEERECLVDAIYEKVMKTADKDIDQFIEGCMGAAVTKHTPQMPPILSILAEKKNLLDTSYRVMASLDSCPDSNSVRRCMNEIREQDTKDFCDTTYKGCQEKQACSMAKGMKKKYCACERKAGYDYVGKMNHDQLGFIMAQRDNIGYALKKCNVKFSMYNMNTLARITKACDCKNNLLECLKTCFTNPQAMEAYMMIARMYNQISFMAPMQQRSMCQCQ